MPFQATTPVGGWGTSSSSQRGGRGLQLTPLGTPTAKASLGAPQHMAQLAERVSNAFLPWGLQWLPVASQVTWGGSGGNGPRNLKSHARPLRPWASAKKQRWGLLWQSPCNPTPANPCQVSASCNLFVPQSWFKVLGLALRRNRPVPSCADRHI